MLLLAAPAQAQDGATAAPSAAPTGTDAGGSGIAYDRVWERFTHWYASETNPLVRDVRFSGRYQLDYAVLDASQGSLWQWNVRRLRLGPKIALAHGITLHGEIELNPQEADPLYVRFTDLYVQWKQGPQVTLTVGKHGVPFTVDGSTSSKELLAIDRSNLANNLWFPQEYIPGVSLSGARDGWQYWAGLFSSGAGTREFGHFDGGRFAIGSLGYDVADRLGIREALIRGSYVYQQPDIANTFTRQLEHVASLNVLLEATRWGARVDLSRGAGYLGQSDVWGTMLMPFVNVTAQLQFVGRHTFLRSSDANGVRLATYENGIVAGLGDRYREWYLGANYFFYGHKLKLQAGLQHAAMDDRADDGGQYAGTSFVSGLRVSW